MANKIRIRLHSYEREDGTRAIMFRYGNAKCYTKLFVKPEDWDEQNCIVLKTDRQYKAKNSALLCAVDKLEYMAIHDGLTEQEFVDAFGEVTGRPAPKKKHKCILDYWDEFQETKVKPGTLKTYTNARKKIEEFDSEVTWETFNKGWLLRFEAWLLNKEFGVNYVSIIMRCLRAVNNYCIDCEYTTVYPFRRFQIKNEPTEKRSLTREQLITLRDYKVEEHQEKYRDAFMLSFYLIGINMADLFSLNKADVKDGYVSYRRAKTGALYHIKIEPEAQALLDKYKGKEHLLTWADEWKMENFLHRCNLELQRIGAYKKKGRGGKKIYQSLFPELTTYWARHTWATLASALDVPVDVIGHALGHSDESHKVTNIYIKFDSVKVDNANRKVLDSIK